MGQRDYNHVYTCGPIVLQILQDGRHDGITIDLTPRITLSFNNGPAQTKEKTVTIRTDKGTPVTAREDHTMSEQDDNRQAQSEALGRALSEAMDGDILHPATEDQPRPTPPVWLGGFVKMAEQLEAAGIHSPEEFYVRMRQAGFGKIAATEAQSEAPQVATNWPYETEGPWHVRVETGAHPSQDAEQQLTEIAFYPRSANPADRQLVVYLGDAIDILARARSTPSLPAQDAPKLEMLPEGEHTAHGHPHSYSICSQGDDGHKCIALAFGETDEEAASRARQIIAGYYGGSTPSPDPPPPEIPRNYVDSSHLENEGRGESVEQEQNKAARVIEAPPLSNERPSELLEKLSLVGKKKRELIDKVVLMHRLARSSHCCLDRVEKAESDVASQKVTYLGLLDEAAKEVTSLESTCERLREALREIEKMPNTKGASGAARAALARSLPTKEK